MAGMQQAAAAAAAATPPPAPAPDGAGAARRPDTPSAVQTYAMQLEAEYPGLADDLRLLLRRRAPVTDYARAQIYWLLRWGDIGGLKAGACLGWTAFLASVYPGLAEEEREKALNRACTNFSRGHSALRKALYQALCMRGMLECSPQEAQQYRDALRELRASAPPVCPACGAKIKCK